MSRSILALAALAASAGCASVMTSGAHTPRPFPGTPAAARRPAPARAAHVPAPSAIAPDALPAAGPSLTTERALVSSALITTALGLQGVPYRLGGTDLNGFDCSGFVQYVLRQHAIEMPRTVIEQFGVGQHAGGIEAGDLVFFQTVGSQASHVGIAIDGASFVHAPNSRGVVRVERLDSPYWSSRFLGARRVF